MPYKNHDRYLEYQRAYHEKYREKLNQQKREHHLENKETENLRNREYAKEHKEEKKLYDKERRKTLGDEYKKQRSEYAKTHRKEINQYRRKHQKERLENDIVFKLTRSLRHRLYLILRGRNKSAPTLELLGCTVEELRKHLEAQFVEGMSWSNIHIDHIIPISYAGDSIKEPFWQHYLCSYHNLQPLFAKDNLRKHDKVKFVKNVILDRQTLV